MVSEFGSDYARKLKRREGRLGDHWYLDEVFIRVNGQQQYLLISDNHKILLAAIIIPYLKAS